MALHTTLDPSSAVSLLSSRVKAEQEHNEALSGEVERWKGHTIALCEGWREEKREVAKLKSELATRRTLEEEQQRTIGVQAELLRQLEAEVDHGRTDPTTTRRTCLRTPSLDGAKLMKREDGISSLAAKMAELERCRRELRLLERVKVEEEEEKCASAVKSEVTEMGLVKDEKPVLPTQGTAKGEEERWAKAEVFVLE
ncbi:hypothetical protein JCM10213_009074 [Rhodosporidiobolus nylandii]